MHRSKFIGGLAVSFALVPFASRAAMQSGYAVTHTDAEWKRILGADRYFILREGGTEPAYSSPLNGEKRAGTYDCAGCNLAVFSSKTKYDSGEGWPSFWNVLPGTTLTKADDEIPGMPRTEVHCKRCGSHLGHIFDDGPAPTHLRYCIDGLAVRFIQA
jgi:peptide-methionine (R)-S-oxide reductase